MTMQLTPGWVETASCVVKIEAVQCDVAVIRRYGRWLPRPFGGRPIPERGQYTYQVLVARLVEQIVRPVEPQPFSGQSWR